jgi:hypothetical protein
MRRYKQIIEALKREKPRSFAKFTLSSSLRTVRRGGKGLRTTSGAATVSRLTRRPKKLTVNCTKECMTWSEQAHDDVRDCLLHSSSVRQDAGLLPASCTRSTLPVEVFGRTSRNSINSGIMQLRCMRRNTVAGRPPRAVRSRWPVLPLKQLFEVWRNSTLAKLLNFIRSHASTQLLQCSHSIFVGTDGAGEDCQRRG